MAGLPLFYNPGPNVIVDEQLMPFWGHCLFRQYIPSKPAKYGIKIWAACDAASSYVWNLQVYTGKCNGGTPENNQGTRVVFYLVQGFCEYVTKKRKKFGAHENTVQVWENLWPGVSKAQNEPGL